MALTKAQTSLVTVATLGVAPGGYQAELAAFATQKDAAAYIASTGLLNAGTDAEFALNVIKNLGVNPTALQSEAFLKALTDGTSRADAAVDFANAQLLANNGKIENVNKAIASTSTSKDLEALKAEVSVDPLTITFKDNETNQAGSEDTSGQTVVNIGKAELDSGANKISADYTFKLADQIGAGDQFSGKFLSPIIEAQAPEKTGSQIVLELRNLREDDASTTPLKSLPTEGFAFTMDGVTLLVASDAINAANTYAELRDAVEARITELAQGTGIPDRSDVSNDPAAYAKLATFKVELGNTFNAQNESGATVTGQQVVMTDSAGSTLKPLAFVNSSDVIIDTGFTLYAELKEAAASTVTKLITTNLNADNVGYGSQGGSVNLAGQSNSDKGVEEIKVTATDGVWFSKLQSKATTDHLERIELQTGSNGYFRVGTQTAQGDAHVVNLTQQDFSVAGLTDVREVEATNAGSTAINSFVSDAVIARDYNLKDTGSWASDNIDINYNLSSGRDVLNLAVDQDVMESTDTQVTINTNAGNDVVHFQTVNGLTGGKINTAAGSNWLTNQQLLNNVKVNAGDGNDQIVMSGAGNATVNAGTGDDQVRADNTGGLAVFVFNNGNTTNINTLSNSDNALSAGANGVAQTYDLFKAVVKVTFQGFESEAVVIDSTNFKTSTLQINQAIKKAIAESPQLSKLLAAHDNEGHALGLESLVDGELSLSDLDITITAPAAYKANETAAEKAARDATGQQMLAENDLLNAAKAEDATTTTAKDITVLNNAVNSLNNSVYATEFATDGQDTSNQLQIQTVDFNGITALPAGHPLSGTTGELTIGSGVTTATVKITAGMSAADIADAAAKALSQEYAQSNTVGFVKAEVVGEQVKVYFNANAPLLASSVTGSTTFLSAKALPTTVVTTAAQTGTAATAAVDGKVTLNFAGADIANTSASNGQIEVTIGTSNILVSVAPGEGGLGIAKAVQEALNSQNVTIGTETLAVTATVQDEVVTLALKGNTTNVAIGNVVVDVTSSQSGFVAATATGLPGSTAATTNYTAAVDAAPAARTTQLSFTGLQVTEAGSITIGGISVSLAAGDDDRMIAKKVVDALNTKVFDGATATAALNGTTGVTVTQNPTAGSKELIPDLAITSVTAGFANSSAKPSVSFTQAFESNGVMGVVDGSDSTAESDNMINLGTGTDLVMMGTDDNSNDTLVLTGYNNGTNTVVNYDGSASSKGVDYLDLSAYVAGQNKVVLGSVANASGTLADKAVAKVAVNAADFAKLTNAEMLAQLNGSATTAITGLAGIDASTTASNYVLMVENSNNPGEYKVFHLSAAANNAGKFASAQTVATLDFGVQSTPSVSNVDIVANLSTAGVITNLVAPSGTDVVKGAALTVDNAAGAGTITLTSTAVAQINNANLDELTLRFVDATDTVALAYGQTLNLKNLTVWGGTLDATAGTLNVSGTVTLNSALKITVDQALALVAAGTKINSDSGTASKVIVDVPTAAEAAKLDAATVTKLKALLVDNSLSVTGSGASAADAAGGALFETVSVANIGTLTSYNLSDTAANLAAAVGGSLNNALNITASDAATVAQAEVIADATNSANTTFNVEDTATNVITGAKQTAATGKNGLAEAGTITLEANTAGDKEAVTFNNLTADAAATTIDFADNAVTLTQAELKGIADVIGLTDADVITVTGVTAAAGDFAEAATIDKLNTGDIITADSNAIALTAANYKDVFNTAGVLATAGDTITVSTLNGASVAATAADDVFSLLTTDTSVTITDFVSADDTVALGGSNAVTALTVAGIDGSETLILDTAANLGANAVSIGDQSGGSAVHWAVASDTGAIYYDADGDWTGGVVVVGTVTADTLTAADFTVA